MSKIALTSLLFLFTTASLSAYDAQEAQEMFAEAKCMECHNNKDFAPRKEKVNTFKKLHSRVMSCQIANDAEWFDEDALNVSEYLNKKFYHFQEK